MASRIAEEQEKYRRTLHATKRAVHAARHAVRREAAENGQSHEELADRVSNELGSITPGEWKQHLMEAGDPNEG